MAGKRRKASWRTAATTSTSELDPADARLGPISTFEDVADSEDEFFLQREHDSRDDHTDTNQSRRLEEEGKDFSDEEILPLEDSDFEEPEGGSKHTHRTSRASAKNTSRLVRDGAAEGQEEEEGNDSDWWGSSQKEYYNADNIETEADALEEEAEAKRMRQKKLSKMKEEDFGFDKDEWLAAEAFGAEDAHGTVTEVLRDDIEILNDMGAAERSRLLAARYPELEYLGDEFVGLQKTLSALKDDASTDPNGAAGVKFWILGCYVAAIASYFAILTSSARDTLYQTKIMTPSEIRDHDVMSTLLHCRTAWERIKLFKKLRSPTQTLSPKWAPANVISTAVTVAPDIVAKKVSVQDIRKKALHYDVKATSSRNAEAVRENLAGLYGLPLGPGRVSVKYQLQSPSKVTSAAEKEGDSSDFGEEIALDSRTAADKAARRKSLKFYTSQIVQKASRRVGAGRDAGGDTDIPYRERLRDRQTRLLAEAKKRGQRGFKRGANLGDESHADQDHTAGVVRDDANEYYDMVVHASRSKREKKAARYATYAAASKTDRVVEQEVIGEDGKRKITYAIDKNKGLAPKRSKEVRNPRVRRRKQYDAKQKKLKSMRPVWQGGQPKGPYHGEPSGINIGVVKSVRL